MGIAQTSELKETDATNLNSWNKKDFLSLKNTLNPFILHVRFFNISSKDFHIKVWPFKKVLPETLFEDIVSFHMAEIQPTVHEISYHLVMEKSLSNQQLLNQNTPLFLLTGLKEKMQMQEFQMANINLTLFIVEVEMVLIMTLCVVNVMDKEHVF